MISEFYCDVCVGWNTVSLLDNLNGLHIVECGGCGHSHYRIIKEGTLTDLRYDMRAIEKYKLNAFTYKGQWRKEPWEKHPFLSELWARHLIPS